MTLRAILFDLDGTLVQTREASWSLFAQTNRKFALGIDTRAAFFDLFQENLFRSLRRHCEGRADVDAVVQHFLDLLRGQYCPPLIPGMSDVIRSLASRFTLVVISTNAIGAIRKILTAAGVEHCFAHVFSGDVEPDKSVCIRRFLQDPAYALGRRCSAEYDEAHPPDKTGPGDVVLVTDTVGDVKEAMSCGIRAVGVAWGMHGQEQLTSAGADRVALWPQEIAAWLLPEGAEPTEATACTACACEVPVRAADRLLTAGEIRSARRAVAVAVAAPAPTPAPTPRRRDAPPTTSTTSARPLDPELLRAITAVGAYRAH